MSRSDMQKLLLNPLVVDAIIDILLPAGVASGVVEATLARSVQEDLKLDQKNRTSYLRSPRR